MESIEDGARMHGIDPGTVVDELNRLARIEESSKA